MAVRTSDDARQPDEQLIALLGRQVSYRVRLSPRARRARIGVGPSGVEVVLPARTRPARAEALLREHAVWVLKQTERAERLRESLAAEAGLSPGHLLLRGAAVPVAAFASGRNRVELAGGRVVVWGDDPPRALERWLREQARRDLTARVAHHAAGVSRPPGRLFVRDQRTRWGSCASSGTLSFSWRLVMAPPAVLDYVAAHEVAHLDVPNHSRDFWQLVRRLFGDYEEHRAWLRRHQPILSQDLRSVLHP